MQKKNDRIRKEYNNSAEFYNSRYEIIQYIKYSMLLPKLIDNDGNFNYLNPFLDYGAGSGLLVKYFLELWNYVNFGPFKIENETDEKKLFCFEFFLIQNLNKTTIEKPFLNLPLFVLCDISQEMLNLFQKFIKNVKNLSIKDRIGGLVTCNGEHLPFRDKIFGTVTSFTVLQNLSDIKGGTGEIKRVSQKFSNIGISLLKKKQKKLEFIRMLRENLEGFKSIIINDDFYQNLLEIASKLYKKLNVFIQNSFVDEIKNIEDFFFFKS